MHRFHEIPKRQVEVETPASADATAIRGWVGANRWRRPKIIASLLLALVLCNWVVFLAERDDIRAAVFSEQMGGHQPYATTFYLSVGENRDPSDRLIRRLAEEGFPVEGASQVRRTEDRELVEPLEVYQGKVQRSGHILQVESVIVWLPFFAVARGGVYQAPLSGSVSTYWLLRGWNGWTAVGQRLELMS